jgi:Domain of unknown function (DUF4268)
MFFLCHLSHKDVSMPLYEYGDHELKAIDTTTFDSAGVLERQDLQCTLRDQIEIIAPGVLVVDEEFGRWEDSRRRIDLLGVDKQANLVVIELKRTEDGGHMELQALRYAAMVSTMTFEQVVETFETYLSARSKDGDARKLLLEHLGWGDPEENMFAQDVRIILASANFSKELTSAVLWINERGLDVTCVRLLPYADGQRVLLDVQQVIPLPEAEDYQVRVKSKQIQERRSKQAQSAASGLRREFFTLLLEKCRAQNTLHANLSPTDQDWIAKKAGMKGVMFTYRVRRNESAIELYVDGGPGSAGANTAVFERLKQHKADADHDFGQALEWDAMQGRQGCRVLFRFPIGWDDDPQKWSTLHDKMIDGMSRLQVAFRPVIDGMAT